MMVEDGTAIAQCLSRVPERFTARSSAAPMAPASRHSLSTTAPFRQRFHGEGFNLVTAATAAQFQYLDRGSTEIDPEQSVALFPQS
jgi:hypothetical protein